MSDVVYIRVPRSTLDASDQAGDAIQSPRGMLFEMSVAIDPPRMKVAYNAEAENAKVIDECRIAALIEERDTLRRELADERERGARLVEAGDAMALRCLAACDGLAYDTPEDEAAILAVEAYNFTRAALDATGEAT